MDQSECVSYQCESRDIHVRVLDKRIKLNREVIIITLRKKYVIRWFLGIQSSNFLMPYLSRLASRRRPSSWPHAYYKSLMNVLELPVPPCYVHSAPTPSYSSSLRPGERMLQHRPMPRILTQASTPSGTAVHAANSTGITLKLNRQEQGIPRYSGLSPVEGEIILDRQGCEKALRVVLKVNLFAARTCNECSF
jgi:hypothetical protein